MANTTKKLTKKDHYNALLKIPEVKNNPVLVEFINHELELLAKKNSADKKPTENQIKNAGLKDVIYKVLGDSATPLAIPEITKLHKDLEGMSPQKISALLRQLMEDQKVERIMDKRQAKFTIKK